MPDYTRQLRAARSSAAATPAATNPVVTADDAYRPTVAPKARDIVYWLTLGTAAASALASGIAGIWFPGIAPEVLATGGVATTVMGIVGGGVGVIYRPGAQ